MRIGEIEADCEGCWIDVRIGVIARMYVGAGREFVEFSGLLLLQGQVYEA
jgi:hypothetical protein